jgi:hypothetical protein
MVANKKSRKPAIAKPKDENRGRQVSDQSSLGGGLHVWLQNEFNAIRGTLLDTVKTLTIIQSEIQGVTNNTAKIEEKVISLDSRVTAMEDAELSRSSAWLGPKKVIMILSTAIPVISALVGVVVYAFS